MIFWSLVGHILRLSWQMKPHGHCKVSHTMCILLLTFRGDLHLPPENILRSRSQASLNPAAYPPRYEMKMAVQEFHKLHEPKINKLKGGYSAMANLIFHSWLKDIKVHIEDWDLTERGHSTGQGLYS